MSSHGNQWTDSTCESLHVDLQSKLEFSDSDAENHDEHRLELQEIGRYPPSLQPDWSNLKILHRNTLPPRSWFHIYRNEPDALTRDISKSYTKSLSGTWKFKLEPFPLEPAPPFYESDFDATKWDDIQVPGMWQLQGHGKGPQYTNVNFPWPVNPPNIPFDDNETGYYVRKFVVPEDWRKRKMQIRLRFEGVDSGFHVWLNGKEVGYSQGARNPSEWNVTEALGEGGEQTLAVRVYQRCDGSYLEDQDQWWLSGIFRDVSLFAFPKVHVKDLKVDTHLRNLYTNALLCIRVDLSQPATVHLKLLDHKSTVVATASQNSSNLYTVFIEVQVDKPKLWSCDSPYLYDLVISVGTDHVIHQRVGFRQVDIVDGILRVNGHRIVLRGVNRHEHHPDVGRAVPYDFMRGDLLLMKKHNINAIRTSHYINDPRLYDVADELGFWVLDECDLECHGMGELGGDWNSWTSDNPDWHDAYLDRVRQMVMRDKNHPSIIMWSLGNESFYGRNHKAMYRWIKDHDRTRPVHYEPDGGAQSADVFSRMYWDVGGIVRFATQDEKWEKPIILCEYIHAMGNGPGGIKEYVEAFYKYPRLQGGFVWEWANHGLRTKVKEGKYKGVEYYGYGGDFGDVPNDGHFVLDGLCFSDHTPTPGLREYKKAIEPVQVIGVGPNDQDSKFSHPVRTMSITNRYDCIDLSHLKASASISTERPQRDSWSDAWPIKFPNTLRPGETEILKVRIPPQYEEQCVYGTEVYLNISFTLAKETLWAKAGHEVAFAQVQVRSPRSIPSILRGLSAPDTEMRVDQRGATTLIIRSSGGSRWVFDQARGKLTWWQSSDDGVNILESAPVLSFYRPLTDNDAGGGDGGDWRGSRLHQAAPHNISTSVHMTPDQSRVVVTTKQRIAPPVFEWSIDAEITYTFFGDNVLIKARGRPRGLRLPPTFSRIGLEFKLKPEFNTAEWWGRGPGESYRDTKESQKFGVWRKSTDELYTPYEWPQESGNRTDVRHVTFSSSSDDQPLELKAHFGDLENASFTAHHYETTDLDCKDWRGGGHHAYELVDKKRKEVCVRLDWAHHGIGSGSCGPRPEEQYRLKVEEFEYEVLLELKDRTRTVGNEDAKGALGRIWTTLSRR